MERGARASLDGGMANLPGASDHRSRASRPAPVDRTLPPAGAARAARASSQHLRPDRREHGGRGSRGFRLARDRSVSDRWIWAQARRSRGPCPRHHAGGGSWAGRRRRHGLGAAARSRRGAHGVSRGRALRVEFRRRGAPRPPLHARRGRLRRERMAARMARRPAIVLTPRLPWPLDDGGRIALWQTVWAAAQEYDVTLLSFVPQGSETEPPPRPLIDLGVTIVRVPFRPPPLPVAAVSGLIGRWPYTLARYRSVAFERFLRERIAVLTPAY